jgi:hypothetical protein
MYISTIPDSGTNQRTIFLVALADLFGANALCLVPKAPPEPMELPCKPVESEFSPLITLLAES